METINELRNQYFELRRQAVKATGKELDKVAGKIKELTIKLQRHESMIGTSTGNSQFGGYNGKPLNK